MNRIRLNGVFLLALVTGGCASAPASRDPAVAAEVKAVAFLSREVPAWSRDNGCYSCHNNGDAARALYLATQKGRRLPACALADTTAWVVRPDRWEHNKGDPGFSDQRLANLQFAASLLAAIETGRVRDRRPLAEAARKVAADQDGAGAWPVEPQNAVGSPATWGTTLATFMAWRTLRAAEAPEAAGAVRKAGEWLRRLKPNNVPAAATLLLWSASEGNEAERKQQTEALAFLRQVQTGDGGWGPYADAPPEVFDTALALLALADMREAPGAGEMIRRGRTFLVATQRPDGSWPATTRPSGGASYAQQMSTTGWAALSLLATQE